MTSWAGGAKLDQASFAERFFGRAGDDPAVAKLCNAAMGVSVAKRHDELRDAASELASAQQMIGLDRWRGFLADAQDAAAASTGGADPEKHSATQWAAHWSIRQQGEYSRTPFGPLGGGRYVWRLTKGGKDVTPPDHPGKLIQMPDGSHIGDRPQSTGGPPTIDVKGPGIQIRKLKFLGN
jgi:hypothetical protein